MTRNHSFPRGTRILMAARNPPLAGRPWTPEKVRQRMRTTMLVRRLTDHVLGKVAMDPSQVTAGLGLLRKTLPDLSTVDTTLHGDPNAPVSLVISSSDGKL